MRSVRIKKRSKLESLRWFDPVSTTWLFPPLLISSNCRYNKINMWHYLSCASPPLSNEVLWVALAGVNIWNCRRKEWKKKNLWYWLMVENVFQRSRFQNSVLSLSLFRFRFKEGVRYLLSLLWNHFNRYQS